MKKVFTHIFIDGMNGMSIGFFCTFVIGTILQQMGDIISRDLGDILTSIGGIAIILTGAGIATGLSVKYQAPLSVTLSSIVAGMVGAYSDAIYQSSIISSEGFVKLSGGGDPLGAFIAAFVAIEVGTLIYGKTSIDVIITPALCTGLGCITALLSAPIIDKIMNYLAQSLQWSLDHNTFIMGMFVACIMCIVSILPISTFNLILLAELKGLSAGAATIGICCAMVGLAVVGLKDNKHAGILVQGIGTPKLQLSNFLCRPYIMLPSLIASAILGGISTSIFKITNTAYGASMANTGLVGCERAYNNMVENNGSAETLIIISLMFFVLPGVCSYAVAEALRKLKILNEGDMKLPS